MDRSKDTVRKRGGRPAEDARTSTAQRWVELLQNARAWVLLAIAVAVLLCIWATSIATARMSVEAEAKSLAAALNGIAPRLATSAGIGQERAEIVQMAGEFSGWQTSRVTFAAALSYAIKSHPQNLEIRRLTLQQTFANGGKETGLPYYPRFRSNRLTIGGLARGARYESGLDQYVAQLSAAGRFGPVFGQLKLSGQMKDASSPDVTYEFLIEGNSGVRRIDPVGTP